MQSRRESPTTMFFPKGAAGLLIAAALVTIILVGFPAARLILLFSIPLGIIVAAILYWWHKRTPVEVEDKRPLKLD
jgi:hypothetical protein